MQFRIMITNTFRKPKSLGKEIVKASGLIVERLLAEQARIANQDYNRRTGGLVSTLESKPYTVSETPSAVNLVINYPATIRFLDLKKTAKGKKKRYYSPIYNRPLFGHLYGSGYSLTNLISLAIHGQMDDFIEDMRQAFKTLDL